MTTAALLKYTVGSCRTRTTAEPVPAIRYPNGEVAVIDGPRFARYGHGSTAARTFRPDPALYALLKAELELAMAEREHEEALGVAERLAKEWEAALVTARAALDRRDRAERNLAAIREELESRS